MSNLLLTSKDGYNIYMREIAIPKEKSVIAEQLAVYPPKLRKLGRYMIEIGQLITLKEACEAVNVNYDSVRTQMTNCKRKGNDFVALVNSYAIKKLDNYKTEVYNSMSQRAISGSLGHQKLFAQLTGDLIDRQQVDHNIQAKIVVFSPSKIPQDLVEEYATQVDENGVQIIDHEFDK